MTRPMKTICKYCSNNGPWPNANGSGNDCCHLRWEEPWVDWVTGKRSHAVRGCSSKNMDGCCPDFKPRWSHRLLLFLHIR
jgi:hypothetical protein